MIGDGETGKRRQANERQEHHGNGNDASALGARRVQLSLLGRKILDRQVGQKTADRVRDLLDDLAAVDQDLAAADLDEMWKPPMNALPMLPFLP